MRRWRVLLVLGLAGRCRCSDGPETELHDAHRELELLAQRLKVPTELPTVVLVGHHNDGKSGLLEALLGIRISHVGSSITTRRPLRIHAQHDARFETPVLYLTRDSGEEQACTASELHAHVEAENERLAERGTYDSSEIRVRLVWRHAASLVLIDTPGLLSVPAALGETADAAMVRQSEEVQALVLKQLAPPNRLIMCLEDTSDWQVPLTRAVVQRVDPKLSRTVLVATKLDSKLSQFSMPEDLHRLLDPRALLASQPDMLAGPIFTSVPPLQGQTDAAFLGAIQQQEEELCGLLKERLGSGVYGSRIGVGAVRRALAAPLRAQWAQLLASTSKALEGRLESLQRDLDNPAPPPAQSIDDFVERFCGAVQALIRGTIAVPAAAHGETLEDERKASGSGPLCLVPSAAEEGLAENPHLEADLAAMGDGLEDKGPAAVAALDIHGPKRLYGGAQYWRALQEFSIGAWQGAGVEVTAEEIVNAMGFDGYHDGVNYMRAVCVLVLEKAKGSFEGNLARLRLRLLHVMRRLVPLVDAMLQQQYTLDAAGGAGQASLGHGSAEGARLLSIGEGAGTVSAADRARLHAQLMGLAARVFEEFVDEAMAGCMRVCMHDVQAVTKYVVWDFHSPSKEALYNLFIEPVSQHLQRNAELRNAQKGRRGRRGGGGGAAAEAALAAEGFCSYEELVESFTDLLTSRKVTEQMRVLMSQLVGEILGAWREEFCRMISLKLHSYFLMPFCEALPAYMRRHFAQLTRDQALGLPELFEDEPDRRAERIRAEVAALMTDRVALQQVASRMRRRADAPAAARPRAAVGATRLGKASAPALTPKAKGS